MVEEDHPHRFRAYSCQPEGMRLLWRISPGKLASRRLEFTNFPRSPFLDREGLMSGDATGINYGDEQEWWRGSV